MTSEQEARLAELEEYVAKHKAIMAVAREVASSIAKVENENSVLRERLAAVTEHRDKLIANARAFEAGVQREAEERVRNELAAERRRILNLRAEIEVSLENNRKLNRRAQRAESSLAKITAAIAAANLNNEESNDE